MFFFMHGHNFTGFYKSRDVHPDRVWFPPEPGELSLGVALRVPLQQC